MTLLMLMLSLLGLLQRWVKAGQRVQVVRRARVGSSGECSGGVGRRSQTSTAPSPLSVESMDSLPPHAPHGCSHCLYLPYSSSSSCYHDHLLLPFYSYCHHHCHCHCNCRCRSCRHTQQHSLLHVAVVAPRSRRRCFQFVEMLTLLARGWPGRVRKQAQSQRC